jgi:phosphatidylglycerol:prolipoprotein diacylglycerol transferase
MPVFALPFPVIDPVALSFGPIAIKWYGLAYVAGLLGGWWYCRKLVAAERLWGGRARPGVDQLDDMLLFVALGVVLGGRLGFVLFYDLERYLARPQDIVQVWQGGMSFHGGLVGATLGLWLFARRRGIPAMSVFDLAATVVPIGLFLGRIANFVNAELWGRAAPDVPWAMVFPNAGPVPRHPSQLYEAFGEGILLFILLGLVVRAGGLKRPGLVAGLFGMGYAVARIVCEFFREPDPQLGFLFGTAGGTGGGLTMGMLLSLPLFAAGLVLALRARREPAAS